MKLTLRSVTFYPATGDVTMLMEHALGGGFSVTTTEAKLVERLAPGVTLWGNEEALAEAQALVATAKDFRDASARSAEQFPEEGCVVAFAPPPPPKPEPEPVIGAPAGLAFVADGTDGSKGTLSWATGTNAAAYNVRVLRRLTALSAASDAPVVDLLAGSTATPLSGMLPSTNYTVTVQHIDPATGIVASSTTLAFASGATVLVLTEPTKP